MATLVSAQMREIATAAVKRCGYKSAVLSGIVPDSRHLKNGGYHCSVEDLRRFGKQDDYSNTRADDRNFNLKYGAGIDVTMSAADMKKHHKRVYAVWKDHSDPRRGYINAVNTWDGSGDAVRLDFVANVAKYASPDHKWHWHFDLRRRYLQLAKAARAAISMFAGESKATWIAREEKPAVPIIKPPAKPVVVPPVKPPVVVIPKPPVKPVVKPKAHKPGSRQLQYVPGKTVLKGDDVIFLQKFIGPKKAGTANGLYGAKAKAAVRWYQGMRGLKADGICGAKTWAAMGVKSSF
jgi:peptidoglycan hydrolase-like protein with peptidoglycan-binding domain